jgi:Holliday junction resolvase RusA-like endonuclease
VSSRGGYQPARVTNFEKGARRLAKQAAAESGWTQQDGPLQLTLVFHFRCPKADKAGKRKHLSKQRRWRISRPDLDNLEKCITDGLKDLMVDDAQICRKITEKVIESADGPEGITVYLQTLSNYEDCDERNETLVGTHAQSDGSVRPDK